MSFPKEKIISERYLAQILKDSGNNERFCFILGSGASVESGIPDGKELEMRWMEEITAKELFFKDFKEKAKDLEAAKKLEHSFDDIYSAWETAKKEQKRLESKYYFDLYKLRFYPHRRNGYRFLERLMEGREPSMGYRVLAKLLTQDGTSNNLVITTNFDSLVEDSLFLYTDKKPLVAGHESLACYIDSNAQRPVIAKVHRSLLFEPFNATEETSELKDEWKEALEHVFATYTPIVIGYAGGDQSLMTFLKDEKTRMKKGLYWCYRGKSDPPDYIQEFVKKKDGILVSIDGFDSLMLTIGSTLFAEEVTPEGTEACLKARMDQRMTNYNKQYAEVLKNTELKESVQAIDELQKANEKQREEANALTAWDYILRGNRFFNEGDYSVAIEEYTKAIKADSKLAAAYNNRGIVYRKFGKYAEAIADYIKAMELDPKYAKAYSNRAIAYRATGQIELAEADEAMAAKLENA